MKQRLEDDRAAERLAAIAAEHELPPAVQARLADLLARTAADPRAPTSVRTPAAAVDVHVADSLSALPLLDALQARHVVDVGSGAGFPGLPLAIARPALQVDLLESAARKCAYLGDVVGSLALPNTRVVHERVEDWGRGEGRSAYDAVLLRALGTLPMVLEYAAPLLRDAGLMIAWRGRHESSSQAAAAATILGMELDAVLPVEPYPRSRDRHLHVYRRVGPVPDAYPRRPGMARKRPLGG